ncbi:unnamed protein product [Leptidea sinapis]|uniref:Uncharacterized protein n=1 Tax=Leptidea sinapis TaxID=189913 RepID=A0A5E4R4H3_9NEOP|nr:unnamed protein product [Leptidea sinapis]
MKLKLNNEEERRRTGRYIAILVGICLLLLAIYQAWVRRIPVIASLVVPALIMFIYVGWVLYTASRDKKRLLDAEAALNAAAMETIDNISSSDTSHNNIEICLISSKESSKPSTPDESTKAWIDPFNKWDKKRNQNTIVKPIILLNDQPIEDVDEKWAQVLDNLYSNDKLKTYQRRKRFRRRFCRRKRFAAFKRSYSIG